MHVVYFASTQVSDPVTLTATSVCQARINLVLHYVGLAAQFRALVGNLDPACRLYPSLRR